MSNEAQSISDNILNINDHVPASVGGLRGHIFRPVSYTHLRAHETLR